MTSPITTEWLGLPADIRSAAETAVGHLRPLTHAEVLLIVGRAIKAERERAIDTDYDEIRRGARIAADAEYAIGPDETAFDRAIDAALEWSFMAISVAAAAPPSPKPAALSEGGEDE